MYIWYDLMGLSADQIARDYNLTLPQVHAALTYAYEHLDEIREAIRQEDEFIEQYMREHPSKLRLNED